MESDFFPKPELTLLQRERAYGIHDFSNDGDRNVEYLLQQKNLGDPIIDDPVQDALVEEYLAPCMPEFVESIFVPLREAADECYLKLRDSDTEGKYHLQRWPIGFCKIIRDHVRLFFLRNDLGPENKQEEYLLNRWQEFIEAGGRMDSIYGIQRNVRYEFMQNAFRVGGRNGFIIDVAMDTVTGRGPKVEYGRTCEMGFENIETYQQYYQLDVAYRRNTTFANRCFPYMSRVLPAFSIDSDGVLSLSQTCSGLDSKNMFSGWRLAEDFLCDQRWGDLPPEYIEEIQRRLPELFRDNEMESARRTLAFFPGTQKEVLLKTFDLFREFLSTSVGRSDDLLTAIHFQDPFNDLKIRPPDEAVARLKREGILN